MQTHSDCILLNIAREHLEQHYAIDAGLDPKGWRLLGSDPKHVDEQTRAQCRERMTQCTERAHEVIAGLIARDEIKVWRERECDALEAVLPAQAVKAFDGRDGSKASKLYLRKNDWFPLQDDRTSSVSKAYFADAGGPVIGREDVDDPLFRFTVSRDRWRIGPVERLKPWWNLLTSLAWIATRSEAYAEALGQEGKHSDRSMAPYLALSVLHMFLSKHECKCSAQQIADPEKRHAECRCTIDAGHHLLEAVRQCKVTPIASDRDGSRQMAYFEFALIGNEADGSDWLRLKPQPLFSSAELVAAFPQNFEENNAGTYTIDRVPAVKTGRPPSDDRIRAKADEMKARGLDGRQIAKLMRSEAGFEHVAVTEVRKLIKGRWKPGGRPKKSAQ